MLTLAMLIIGIVFVIESLFLGLGSLHRPGAGLLPFFTGTCLFLILFFSLAVTFLTARKKKIINNRKLVGHSIFKVITIIVALAVYVLLLPWLGYLMSTFLLLTFLFRAGGFQRWLLILVVAFLTVSLSYLLFSSWLNIRFPKGFLGF